jgi:AraC-like DNA-binding protein
MTEAYKKVEPFEGKPFPFRMTVQEDKVNLVPLHWHEHVELIKVLKGKVKVHVNGNEFESEKNEIIFINSSVVHSVQSLTGFDAAICGMVFDKFFLSNVTEGFETSTIYSLFLSSNTIENRFVASTLLWRELDDCIEQAYKEYCSKDLCYEMSLKSYVYRIMTLILRYNRDKLFGNKNFTKLSSEFDRIRPVIYHIDSRYADKLYIEQLSKIINMSPFHFCRFFKRVTGMSPTEYINKVRIDMALKYLVDSDLTITEISEKVGFCSINYFDEVFKKRKGLSPVEFRKMVKK